MTAKRVAGSSRKAMACEGCGIVLAGLDPEGTLTGCGAEVFWIQTLPHPFRLFETVEACSGQQNCIHLPFGQLAKAGIDIAAKFDSLDIGPKRFQLRAPTLAAGADTGPCGKDARLA